jgi:dTDP-4-dehydrorhamnose 3,5-epimerase
MPIIVEDTRLAGVKVITPKRFGDARGSFCETYNVVDFANVSPATFVQDNQSLSVPVGTLRGLHFQSGPSAQGKLVRVLAGAILDVAVDLRKSSPTFGHHVAVELSDENGKQLWVPVGFAHGFVTRTPNTSVFYKVTAAYDPTRDHGLAYNDPALGIDWGIGPDDVTLSDKDRKHPALKDLTVFFK